MKARGRFQESEVEFLASCAPLSRPFLTHLFEHFVRSAPERNLPYEDYQDYREMFYRHMVESRAHIFEKMQNQMHGDQIQSGKEGMSTDFFLQALQEVSPSHTSIQAQTLSPWVKSNLLRKGFNRVEPHSFAEVLLARMIDKRAKGWLPAGIPKGEPHMWVFYQAPPSLYVDGEWVEQPIQVIPYPLRSDLGLATSGILWSPWEGLIFDGWLHIPNMGAIRFLGQKMQNGRNLWDINFADLSRWGFEADPHLGTLGQSEEGRQLLAHRALLDLAMKYLAK